MVLFPNRRTRHRLGCLVGATMLWCIVVALPARAQIFKLPHPDTTAGNFFGNATALDGDRALVGATGENVCGDNSGTAYVFERDPATQEWNRVAQLVPSDCKPQSFFGRSVSLSGNRALVAASSEFFSTEAPNAAYVFERDSTGQWRETARLTMDTEAREGPFAAAVSLDGDRALVTTAGDPVKGQYGGVAYLYERNVRTGRWQVVARLTGSGGTRAGIFGGTAALDGDRAVVSASTYFASRPGSVYIFERDPEKGQWHEAARIADVDDFFISVDIDGDDVLIGESKAGPSQSGEATLYRRDAFGAWRHAGTLQPRTPYKHGAFGTTVALQGDYALIAGYDEQLGLDFNIDRVVYVFKREGATGAWQQHHIIDIGETAFGSALAFDRGLALIGNVSEQHAGEAYVVYIH